MKRFILLLSLLTLPLLVAPVATVSAVDPFNEGVCEQDAAKNATVCKDKDIRDSNGNDQNPLFGSGGVLTSVIGLLSVVVAIVSVIIIVLAGLKFITSGTNPQDVTKAREQVLYACVGLIIAGLAQVIVRFILDKI
jgi:Type IV secretion system pilin